MPERSPELVFVNGPIADGNPHLHVAVSCGESEVMYLAEVAILKFKDLGLARRLDSKFGIHCWG